MAEGPVQQVNALIAEAESHEKQEQWREAVDAWRGLAMRERDLQFFLRGGLAAEAGGFMAEAEQFFRDAMRCSPERAAGYMGLGMVLNKQGRLEDARLALEHGLTLEEQQFALTILGGIQRRLGLRAAAQTSLRRSVELNPTDEEAHYALGLALAHEEPLTAIEHFRRALELNALFPDAHRELGAALWKLGRLEEAQVALSRALSEDPSDAWAHEHLGLVLKSLGDWPSAKREFLEATSHAPDVGLFWRSLADVCAMLGERDDAERHYLKALSLGVDDPYANARYGIFLKTQGQLDKARTYLRRALDLKPTLKQAREVLGELGEGQ